MAMCVSWQPRGVSTVASSVRFKLLVKRVVTVMMAKTWDNLIILLIKLIIAESENHHDIMGLKW